MASVVQLASIRIELSVIAINGVAEDTFSRSFDLPGDRAISEKSKKGAHVARYSPIAADCPCPSNSLIVDYIID